MLIGLLENGNRRLDFGDHSKEVTEQQWKEMFMGKNLVKTATLTDDEFRQLHENIESKRTGHAQGLSKINREILDAQAQNTANMLKRNKIGKKQ